MSSMDDLFTHYFDQLCMAYHGQSKEELQKLLEDIPKAYEKNKLCTDHYIALMNLARTQLRILTEEN